MNIPKGIFLCILLVLPALGVFSGCSPSKDSLPNSGTDTPPPAVEGAQQSSGTPPETPQETGAVSTVFVQKNTDGTDDGFEKLLSLMQSKGLSFYKKENSAEGFIGAHDVVLLEINCQWAERGGTNTDLLKSIIQAIIQHPDTFQGEIIIADNGQGQYGSAGNGGSLDWEKANSKDRKQSVLDVVDFFAGQGYAISGVLWDEFTGNQVSEFETGDDENGFVLEDQKQSTGIQITYAKFTTKYGTKVSFKKGIWNKDTKQYDAAALKVISVPVLKSHGIYQVTAAIKKYMGTASYTLTRGAAHNNIGRGAMGTQMALTRIPVLNILDAIWVTPDGGPNAPYSRAVETNMILASTDPVALDYWASKNILMEAARKSGNKRYPSMSPDGTEPGTFGYWLRLSMEELQKAGFQTTMDEDKISVHIAE
ncbi:DUF362 domain-containing protein [Candidatus Formimonas warabiya]|uniref:DUF362 domain-containing protein n=1 Tax=Formimonas warabiya TaxID=1761012 RepID=UPI0011D08807|nr:DUF362 domain-containing protein [Candidatus Formimonas warabiya]